MKKTCCLLSIALLLPLLFTSAAAEICRGFEYKVLEDGTACITRYNRDDDYVEIPATLDGITVTSIDDDFFLPRCVTALAIPDTITQIHGNPITNELEDDLSLTDILVSETHPTLATIDGVLFSKPDKRLICYPPNRADSSYEIPQGIEIIGELAFVKADNLASISIPDSVTRIDDYAFHYCDSLTSLTLPDGITDIGCNLFWGCESLTSIRVTDQSLSLATIDGVLFHKQDKRLIWYPVSRSDTSYAIPDGIQAIGYAAFASNQFLIDISVPASVTSIEDVAFYGCFSLSSITLSEGLTSIGDSAFHSCISLASITIPESVTSIGDYAFYDCESLASVTIPESVTSIGNCVFRSCGSITSITIPEGVTSIGSYAFDFCRSLTSITIPESVTSIGENAFTRCDSLASITIPENVTSIGPYAFYYCLGLTSITLPGSVTSIGDHAFGFCENLTITAPEGSYAHQYALEHGIPCTTAEYRVTTNTDWLNQ